MKAIAIFGLSLLTLAGCSYSSERSDDLYRPPAFAGSPAPHEGRDLYLKDCAWCHGRVARGTERGPDLVSGTNGPALVDFVLSTGRMPIDDPDEPIRRQDVSYTRAQIDAIVEFSRELGASGPDVPQLDLASAELAAGNELYQENCAACHSTTGIGGALTQGRLEGSTGAPSSSFIAPSLLESTPVQIAEAVRVGPGTMPVFAAETFDADDLDAIVAYVMYLQDPRDAGGAGAGRIGPVAEGAIGWIVGLGLLLLAARWIGTRRGEP